MINKYLCSQNAVFVKDMNTGEVLVNHNTDVPFPSASVIKLPIYAVVMKLWAEGTLSLSEKILCRDEDKLPPCGALYFFTGDERVFEFNVFISVDSFKRGVVTLMVGYCKEIVAVSAVVCGNDCGSLLTV